jgi:nucleoside-diphosphate-sugar epimerase
LIRFCDVSSILDGFAGMSQLGDWLSDKTIAMTGSTGFVGTALTDLIYELGESQDIAVNLITLSRNKYPKKRNSSKITISHFDAERQDDFVRTIADLQVEYIFHLATPTSIERGSSDFANVTRATVELLSTVISAVSSSVKARLINASSGAIYGPGHKEVLDLSSTIKYEAFGESIKDNYTEAKRLSENIVSTATAAGEIEGTNARLFAFMGLGIPLTSHYAIGNFVWDSINNKTIRLRGNPKSSRGFLPREILAANLLELMFSEYRATCHVSNDKHHTLAEYAELLSEISGKPVELLGGENFPLDFYVGRTDATFLTNSSFNLRNYLENWRLEEMSRQLS